MNSIITTQYHYYNIQAHNYYGILAQQSRTINTTVSETTVMITETTAMILLQYATLAGLYTSI